MLGHKMLGIALSSLIVWGYGSIARAATQTVPTTLAAASMDAKSGGGAYYEGANYIYNIWSPGSVSNSYYFPTSGTYTFTVNARGSVAQSVWPNMRISIDSVAVKNITVNSATLANYSFTYQVASGTHSVKIEFTNDLNTGGEDRNLILNKLTISGPSATTTPSPTPTPAMGSGLSVPTTIPAANLATKTTGGTYNDGTMTAYNLWSNGYVGDSFQFPSTATYTIVVNAFGSVASGVWPTMVVRVDGQTVKTFTVGSATAADYSSSVSLSSGSHNVQVAFTNDLYSGGEDRNLYLRTIKITQGSTSTTPSPTPVSATPSPTPVPPTSTTGWSLGKVPFKATSSWNTPIPAGATYTPVGWPAANGWNYTVNWNQYSPAVYVSSSSDPLVAVSVPASWGWPAGTVNIRIPSGVTGASGTDGELVIIDGTAVYSFWQFKRYSTTSASVSSYARADVVTGTGWGTKSPFQGAGITAAGASIFAGLLVQAETDAGEINHALHMAIDSKLNLPGPVGEAIASDGGSNSGISHEGDRFGIPPGVAMPSGLSPLGQKVFRAFQKYGCYNIDQAGGTTVLRAQANAYNSSTMDALRVDLNKLMPLLQRVGY